jgi:hypothetical protein
MQPSESLADALRSRPVSHLAGGRLKAGARGSKYSVPIWYLTALFLLHWLCNVELYGDLWMRIVKSVEGNIRGLFKVLA